MVTPASNTRMRFHGLAAAIPPGKFGSSSPLILLNPPSGIQFNVKRVPGWNSFRVPLSEIAPGLVLLSKFSFLKVHRLLSLAGLTAKRSGGIVHLQWRQNQLSGE